MAKSPSSLSSIHFRGLCVQLSSDPPSLGPPRNAEEGSSLTGASSLLSDPKSRGSMVSFLLWTGRVSSGGISLSPAPPDIPKSRGSMVSLTFGSCAFCSSSPGCPPSSSEVSNTRGSTVSSDPSSSSGSCSSSSSSSDPFPSVSISSGSTRLERPFSGRCSGSDSTRSA